MKRLDSFLERRFTTVWLLLILLCGAMYGVLSLNALVWADEAYTMAMIRHSFREIWQITTADVHPPLYYYLTKLIAAPFGYALPAARFASAIPCIALVAVSGYQLRRLFGERTAFLFMVLYIAFPFTMTYATEVRMYALAELCVFLNAVYAYRCWKENRRGDWVKFALSGAASAYCHYFALVSAGIIYGILLLFILVKKRSLLKCWLLACLGTVVLYLPWMPSFLYQLLFKTDNAYWIEPITFSTLVNYVISVFYADTMASFPVFMALCYAAALVLLLLCGNRERIVLGLCALAVPVGTVLAGVALSILLRPMFVIRYALQSMPLLVLFFAVALCQIQDEMLLSAMLTVSLGGGASNFMGEAKDAMILKEDRISTTLVSGFPDCGAYVVTSGMPLHVSQELSYCDPETPIYTVSPDLLGADNPYPNRYSYDSFRQEDYDTVILFIQEGEAVPEEFSDRYAAEYLCHVTVSGVGQDVWYLTVSS